MLYPSNKVNKIITQERLWDIQKNIEVEEKWALKKEEQEKRTKKSNLLYTMDIKKNIRSLRIIAFLLFITPATGLLGSLFLHNFLVTFIFDYDINYNFDKKDIPGEEIQVICSEDNEFCSNINFKKYEKLSKCNKFIIKRKYYSKGNRIFNYKHENSKEKNVLAKIFITDRIDPACILNTGYKEIFNKFPFFFEMIGKIKSTNSFSLGTSEIVNPIIKGETSISNIVKRFPIKYIFKPLIFLSAFFMFFYWMYYNKILNWVSNQKKINFFFIFGILSALFLFFHVYFLGATFENELFTKIRRSFIIFFILFELLAQAFLIKEIFSKKTYIIKYLHKTVVYLKLIFVLLACISTIIIIIILIFHNLEPKIDYILEWNYFLLLLLFYFLSSIMWRNKFII